MPTCCIENICRVVCDATFEPVLVCDDWRPLACNTRLLEVFQYKSESDVTSQPIREFINRHFTPKEVQLNGKSRQVHIQELTYALVSQSDMSEKMAIVKVKRWEFENRPYYTVSIRDVHILKLLRKELPQPQFEDNPLLPHADSIDFSGEPQLESRLLREFSLLADAIPVMVWICGREGEIYYANKRVKETWGVDVLNDNWEDCLHPDDWERFIPAWNNASKALTAFSLECRYRKKNAQPVPDDQFQWRWHLFHSNPIFDVHGDLKRWVLTAVDVHEWKCAEEEKQRLIASEKMAIEASKLKSAFLSTMSHEIRTPLFGIVGNTCLLTETEITPEQRGFISIIEGSARLMMAVVQDILDFSRIEAGKLTLNKTPFSLSRLISRVARMTDTSAQKKGLSFNLKPLPEDYVVVGDQQRLQQILANLASNAVKFTHEGTVTLEVSATELESGRMAIRITVRDTGIGMAPEVKTRLFTPWTQADSSNRRLYGGSGLGLAISKALADMMGGHISMCSEVGVGSTFWVELALPKSNVKLDDPPSSPDTPMKVQKFEFYGFQEPPLHSPTKRKSPETPTKARKLNKIKAPPPKSVLPPGRKFKVLLAEDNPINQAILVRFLEKMQCIECVLAMDGAQALEEYAARPEGYFDLILLDQSMPKMDGDMVCREIRKTNQDQIVISVSANALLSDRTYFLSIGMNDHVSKPVTFINFRETITKWLLARVASSPS
ncbi:hypothetical protein DSO57_1031440 [Entomophthora muscae]|uniref:Uncharacterized protein n=1 Tax=Entomophthora muscae TaxID=34485 RepID=A0ACC2TBV7_9FUNG|nr:hypothetical protein DSO57_1031440 [Entomophthora muscae]